METQVMPMISAHEDRLQRLEGDRTLLAAVQVEQSTQKVQIKEILEELHSVREVQSDMREIVAEMSATMRFFCEKIETVNERLVERSRALGESVENIAKSDKLQEDRIKTLEKHDAHKEKVFDWKMKFLFGTGAAGAGALFGLLVEWLKGKL